MVTSCSAWFLPNQAFRRWTSMPTPICLTCSFHHAATTDHTQGGNGPNDQDNENQGSRPSLPMPLIKGRDGIVKDLQGQSRGGLIDVQVPELISESREQQRCGLAGHAGKSEHDSGDHAGGCGTQCDR